MPYIPPRKGKPGQLVGYHDSKPISRKYEMRVSVNQQRLASNLTPAEKSFQSIAEDIRDCYGVPFGGQKIFHITDGFAFIADFYFKKFHLAVEIDGSSHYKQKEHQRDEWRTRLLNETANVTVIRFSNKDVLTAPDIVRAKVIDALLKAPRATPSYQKRLHRMIEQEQRSTYSRLDAAIDRSR